MTARYFTSQRSHGDARAAGALPRLLKSRRLNPKAATAEQIHGSRVRVVHDLKAAKRWKGADGLLTDVSGQALAIFTADCVPVFLESTNGLVAGLLHAGWRGVQKRILAAAVRAMRRRWGLKASQVKMWVGPSIGPCCYRVQWDVARYFPGTRRRRSAGWSVNLAEELRRQARRLGVRPAKQNTVKECTMHGRRYFSYRRDRTPKRQVSVIVIQDRL